MPRIRLLTLKRLVFVELALHNLEEWLTFPRFGEVTSDLLRRWGFHVPEPPWSATQTALGLATLGPLVLVGVATTRSSPIWTWLLLLLQMQLAVNVLLPHVPAALAVGGYSPGVLTAVLVNMPFTIVFVRRMLAEGEATPRGVVLAAAVAVIALPLAVGGLLLVGWNLTR